MRKNTPKINGKYPIDPKRPHFLWLRTAPAVLYLAF